jgi:hypothetical protein
MAGDQAAHSDQRESAERGESREPMQVWIVFELSRQSFWKSAGATRFLPVKKEPLLRKPSSSGPE